MSNSCEQRNCEFLFYEALSNIALRPQNEGCGLLLKSPISVTIPQKSHVLIDLLLKLIVPPHIYTNIIPRTGLSSKHCIELGGGESKSNTSGSLKIKLYNHSSVDFVVERGMVIAELICLKVCTPQLFGEGSCSCVCTRR
jgi:dUTP pyrophosphatase